MSIISPICGIQTKDKNAIAKRVLEVNELINRANSKKILVYDTSSTWQAAMRYKPLKFSRGVLFISREIEDLYKKAKTGKSVWKKDSFRSSVEDARYYLTEIARMYRSALKYE